MSERFSNRVVQVRLTERGSDTKNVIGSGFFIAANGTGVLCGPHPLTVKVTQPSARLLALTRAPSWPHTPRTTDSPRP